MGAEHPYNSYYVLVICAANNRMLYPVWASGPYLSLVICCANYS